ncbi:MAG: desulfoferrodoxin [Erysipelotrichales bacterium]|nr:desulfoferrodoxin [Erysipelotrichales bacterium]
MKKTSQKFFKCNICGNFTGLIYNSGPNMVCCGKPMEEQIANNIGEAKLHLPVITRSGDKITIKIGDEAHPMVEDHHLKFIYLETANGGQRKCLEIGSESMAEFMLVDDRPLVCYTYCNLHGLWKKEF